MEPLLTAETFSHGKFVINNIFCLSCIFTGDEQQVTECSMQHSLLQYKLLQQQKGTINA